MADCPGVLHLALMADGGLARLRVPGGSLAAAQARAVADAAERLGSGVIDLTNRANLQIRGLAEDAGPALAMELEAAGFRFRGEADRRRNVLLDPFSGLDPTEAQDLRPLAAELDKALVGAAWIGGLSPKFSFVLDGGGTSGVSGVRSDVTAIAVRDGIEITAGALSVVAPASRALEVMIAVAETAARAGGDVRASDLSESVLRDALGVAGTVCRADSASSRTLRPRYGATPANDGRSVTVALAVPVGRLDAAMLRFLADAAENAGAGRMTLAPWSAVVLSGVAAEQATTLMADAEAVGFVPAATAERLTVIACAGAPSCERAQEPAKALGAALLEFAAAEPGRLPEARRTVHFSACPKGCAGSGSADLLLLGESGAPGWSLHRGGTPRAPGELLGRSEDVSPAGLLAMLAR